MMELQIVSIHAIVNYDQTRHPVLYHGNIWHILLYLEVEVYLKCPVCGKEEFDVFEGWVEDILQKEFSNDYEEGYWDFYICKSCGLKTWSNSDKVTTSTQDP